MGESSGRLPNVSSNRSTAGRPLARLSRRGEAGSRVMVRVRVRLLGYRRAAAGRKVAAALAVDDAADDGHLVRAVSSNLVRPLPHVGRLRDALLDQVAHDTAYICGKYYKVHENHNDSRA
eukprot:scaffold14835_cov74-Phaeocystis_antarctica.AAC.1